MSEFICIKEIYEKRGIPNYCKCFKCRDKNEHKAVLEYYRKETPQEQAHCEPFPEKRGESNENLEAAYSLGKGK